jgi:hypothetical protein
MSNWYWEDVNNLEGAEKAINGGFWAAVFVACVTSLIATLSLFGVQLLGINAWAFVDAGLFVAVAIGIKRKSRFAAVVGLCLYVIERLAMIQRGGLGGIIMGVLFTLLFINAARGAFAYHQMNEGQARPYEPTP